MNIDQEPEATLKSVRVRTEGQTYNCNSVDIYPHYLELWTSREQPRSANHAIIPDARVKEIVEWSRY